MRYLGLRLLLPLGGVFALALLASNAQATSVIYSVDFVLTKGTQLPTGTITFDDTNAAAGQHVAFNILAPLSFSFSDDWSIWDQGDTFNPATSYFIFDSGLSVFALSTQVTDSTSPNRRLTINSSKMWASDPFVAQSVPVSGGTYTLTLIPEPSTALLLAFGIASLAAVGRRLH